MLDQQGGLWNTHEINGHHCSFQMQLGDGEEKYRELQKSSEILGRRANMNTTKIFCLRIAKDKAAMVEIGLEKVGRPIESWGVSTLLSFRQALSSGAFDKLKK